MNSQGKSEKQGKWLRATVGRMSLPVVRLEAAVEKTWMKGEGKSQPLEGGGTLHEGSRTPRAEDGTLPFLEGRQGGQWGSED